MKGIYTGLENSIYHIRITGMYACIHRQYVRWCLMCLYSPYKKNTAGDCVASKSDMHWGFYTNRINGSYETSIYPVQMAHVQVSIEQKQQASTETSVQAALREVVWFLAGARNVYILQVVQTDCRAHPTSYSIGTKRLLPHGAAVGKWLWPFSSIRS